MHRTDNWEGYHAGYAGAALAIMDWAWQLEYSGIKPMPGKSHCQNKDNIIWEVKTELEKGKAKTGGRIPQVIVMGALGRFGAGTLL